jgi:protein unc-119
LSDNHYDLEFLNFTISDYDTKNILFEVGKDLPPPQDMTLDFSSLGEDMYRKIKYTFSEDVLKLPFIQTSLVFSVGNQEVHEFRMIERHYFRNKLVKSFDFEFGFCIPGSVNTWDAVYSVPALSDDLLEDMLNNPFETQSDSFYFVDNCLVMHNKASYQYLREDSGAQSKKSYENKFGSKGVKGSKAAKKGAQKDETYLDDEDDMNTGEDMKAESKGSSGGGRSAKAAKEVVWSKEEDYF